MLLILKIKHNIPLIFKNYKKKKINLFKMIKYFKKKKQKLLNF